eukprot:7386168-Prymnesium_polylepis.1
MPPSVSYGRLLFAQATAPCLHRAYGRPVVAPGGGRSDPMSLTSGRWAMVLWLALAATTVATAALPYSWDTKSATLPWTPISSLALLEIPYRWAGGLLSPPYTTLAR